MRKVAESLHELDDPQRYMRTLQALGGIAGHILELERVANEPDPSALATVKTSVFPEVPVQACEPLSEKALGFIETGSSSSPMTNETSIPLITPPEASVGTPESQVASAGDEAPGQDQLVSFEQVTLKEHEKDGDLQPTVSVPQPKEANISEDDGQDNYFTSAEKAMLEYVQARRGQKIAPAELNTFLVEVLGPNSTEGARKQRVQRFFARLAKHPLGAELKHEGKTSARKYWLGDLIDVVAVEDASSAGVDDETSRPEHGAVPTVQEQIISTESRNEVLVSGPEDRPALEDLRSEPDKEMHEEQSGDVPTKSGNSSEIHRGGSGLTLEEPASLSAPGPTFSPLDMARIPRPPAPKLALKPVDPPAAVVSAERQEEEQVHDLTNWGLQLSFNGSTRLFIKGKPVKLREGSVNAVRILVENPEPMTFEALYEKLRAVYPGIGISFVHGALEEIKHAFKTHDVPRKWHDTVVDTEDDKQRLIDIDGRKTVPEEASFLTQRLERKS